jgi:hypothetical protein
MSNAMPHQPGSHLAGFDRRRAPQAMINRQGRDGTAPALGPGMGQQGQGHAIGTARYGDGQVRRLFERAQGPHQGGELIFADGRHG